MNQKTWFSDNRPGPFQVDTDCIACDTCVTLAHPHFKLTDDNDHAYVVQQPQTPLQWQQCRDALTACPVGAIHEISC